VTHTEDSTAFPTICEARAVLEDAVSAVEDTVIIIHTAAVVTEVEWRRSRVEEEKGV
jgi:hypothetical protein